MRSPALGSTVSEEDLSWARPLQKTSTPKEGCLVRPSRLALSAGFGQCGQWESYTFNDLTIPD